MGLGSDYEGAQQHRLYQLSCGTFALYAVLCLAFHRQDLIMRYGPSIDVLFGLAFVQSFVSYLGDVTCLRGPPPSCQTLVWQSLFLPDIICSLTSIILAYHIFHENLWWKTVFFVSLGCWIAALVQNHLRQRATWLWFHIAWHILPLESYLVTTDAMRTSLASDRCILFALVWMSVAYHVGFGKFQRQDRLADVHAYAVVALIVAEELGAVAGAGLLALTYSSGYALASLVASLTKQDLKGAFAALLHVASVIFCLLRPLPGRSLGFYCMSTFFFLKRLLSPLHSPAVSQRHRAVHVPTSKSTNADPRFAVAPSKVARPKADKVR